MSQELAEIRARLQAPFALDDIDFLPKKTIEKDGKTLCMALPYADPRAYEDRLNELCPGEWSTPTPTAIVVGTKLICFVTVVICGVPHSDVGEANPGENQGTEAWAQGFKRACSQAGLGRYLYDLEKEWVPFNKERKVIDLDKAQKAAVVRKMYQKAGISLAAPSQPASVDRDEALRELTRPGPARMSKNDAALAASKPEPVIENMKTLISGCRNRAYKLDIKTIADYERFCAGIIGKPTPETQADVNMLNADLEQRERAKSA